MWEFLEISKIQRNLASLSSRGRQTYYSQLAALASLALLITRSRLCILARCDVAPGGPAGVEDCSSGASTRKLSMRPILGGTPRKCAHPWLNAWPSFWRTRRGTPPSWSPSLLSPSSTVGAVCSVPPRVRLAPAKLKLTWILAPVATASAGMQGRDPPDDATADGCHAADIGDGDDTAAEDDDAATNGAADSGGTRAAVSGLVSGCAEGAGRWKTPITRA